MRPILLRRPAYRDGCPSLSDIRPSFVSLRTGFGLIPAIDSTEQKELRSTTRHQGKGFVFGIPVAFRHSQGRKTTILPYAAG